MQAAGHRARCSVRESRWQTEKTNIKKFATVRTHNHAFRILAQESVRFAFFPPKFGRVTQIAQVRILPNFQYSAGATRPTLLVVSRLVHAYAKMQIERVTCALEHRVRTEKRDLY